MAPGPFCGKRGMADTAGLILPPSKPSPRGRLSRFAPRGQWSGVSAEFSSPSRSPSVLLPQRQHFRRFPAVAELLFRRILAMGFLDGIASPVPFHNGSNFRISLPLWKEHMYSPSESDTETAEFDPSLEGGGKMPFDPAPSEWVSRAGPAREASEAGRLIMKSRRCWGSAVLVGTFSAGNRCLASESHL